MKKFTEILEVARAQSPADKEFVALHSADKKQFVKYPESQFKGTVKKDESKMTHPSNETGIEDQIKKERPLGESVSGPQSLEEAVKFAIGARLTLQTESWEKIDGKEVWYDHRTAGQHGHVHVSTAHSAKKGSTGDFYDHDTGDKYHGTVTKNDGIHLHVKHPDKKIRKYKISHLHPGMEK